MSKSKILPEKQGIITELKNKLIEFDNANSQYTLLVEYMLRNPYKVFFHKYINFLVKLLKFIRLKKLGNLLLKSGFMQIDLNKIIEQHSKRLSKKKS